MNKKIISVLLVLSMLVGMLAIMPISIGAATTITITSVDDWMNELSGKTVGEANITVTADVLDFSGKDVKPAFDFKGTFNGNGVVMKNITMDTSEDSDNECGLFYCGAGVVTFKNFAILDSSFTGEKWCGSIICCTQGDTTFENIYVKADVTATDTYAGGFIGACTTKSNITVTFKDCVYDGTVTSDGDCNGGFLGYGNTNSSSRVKTINFTNCLMLGSVNCPSDKDGNGFVGYNMNSKTYGSVSTTNCIYAGPVDEDGYSTGYTNYPFTFTATFTANNCYTTSVKENGNLYKVKDTVYTTETGTGISLIDKSTIMGTGASITMPKDDEQNDTWIKREDDIMIPAGVKDFAPAKYAASYTVTWKNYDGTVLDTDEVLAGEMPEYKGEEIPTRPEDTQFIYTFADKWFPAITAVTSDITYTVKFDREIKNNIPDDYYDVWDGTSDDSYTSFGSGTEEDPYIIRTAGQWANLAEAANDGIDDGLYFELATNLDFNDIEGLKPISTHGKRLLIYFDGKGHTIKGVNMTWTSKDGTGLFGDIWGSLKAGEESCSNIKNLVIKESVFNGDNYTGAVVGEVAGNILIQNIYVDSTVTVYSTNGNAGGIIGGCYYASKDFDANGVAEISVTVEDCVFAGVVLANGTKNGGILGNGNSVKNEIFHITINNCLVTGLVPNVKDINSNSSGFVGANEYTQEIKSGEGEEATVVKTYKASVTINNCVYAGGAEDVYFLNRPFTGKASECTVTNSYTTHTAANGVYLNKKWTSSGSGVTLVEIKKLLGSNAVAIDGWTKRAGDMIIPNGVAAFAPLTYTQKMMDGASVRLNNPTGLRFKAVLGKAFLDSIKTANEGKEVTYGIIITPEDYITEAGGEFTIEALSKLNYETDYLEINADKLLDGGDDAGYYLFSGVIYDIDEGNYTREFSARAYVKVDDGNGNVTYYYSAYDSDVNSRSIAEVAKAAYEDTNNAVTDKYKYEIAENSGVYSPYEATKRALLPSFYEKVATDVYFMSYNIRNVEGGVILPFEYQNRQNAVVSYILSENPDVIGLQEVGAKDSTSWFDILGDEDTQVGLTANGYAVYVGKNTSDDDKSDYNPIYYKTSRFELVENGAGSELLLDENGDPYTYYNSREQKLEEESRGYTYVTLRDKKTGEIFVYVNTHLIRKTTTEGYENYQDDMARDFAEALKAKAFEYPVIIGGDFNGSYSVYKEYKAEGDEKAYWGEVAVNARTEATTKISGCSTTNGNFDTLETSDGPIDLYFVVNAENTVIHSYAVTDNKTNVENVGDRYPSDHLPVKLLVTIYGDEPIAQ